MSVSCKTLLIFVCTCLLGHTAGAQSYDPTSHFLGYNAQLSGNTITVFVDRRAQRFPLVRGAPFYGEVREQTVRSANEAGATPETLSRTRMWRDPEGKIRVERPAFPTLNAAREGFPDVVTIWDPAAEVLFVLDMQRQIAHRMHYEPGTARPAGPMPRPAPAPRAQPKAAPAPDPMLPSRKVETLGQQMIEGTVAEGSRETVTFPKGYEGNDRPIVVITEAWHSQELQLIVLSKRNDPHTGVHVRAVTNISKRVPDTALFQVPGDFTIVDEPGAFQFTLTRNRS